jgi:exodeoxyribonuclease VII large subunit
MRLDRSRMELDARSGSLQTQIGGSLRRHRTALTDLERRLLAQHPRQRIAQQRSELSKLESTLMRNGHSRVAAARATLRDLERRLEAASPRTKLARHRGDLAQLSNRHNTAMRDLVTSRRGQLGALAGRLAALSPLAVLERGYAVVRSRDGDRLALRSATQLRPAMVIDVQMRDGTVTAQVQSIRIDPNQTSARESDDGSI